MGNLIDSFVRYASTPLGRDKLIKFMVSTSLAGGGIVLVTTLSIVLFR